MKRIKSGVIILIIAVVIILTGIWWFVNSASSEISSDISTSGFIEAREITAASEVGGRITAIYASEGDRVCAGTPLFQLDDSLLKARENQVEASLNLTRAYLEQAMVARDGTMQAWENARDVQLNPLELETRITAAQGEFDMAELNLKKEQEIETEWRTPVADYRRDTARKVLAALEVHHSLRWTDLELAIAQLSLTYERGLDEYWRLPAAELRRDIARQALENLLKIKENPQEINAAVDMAYTAYQTAVTVVAAAERQVEQAEASLAIIRVQLSQLTFSSPISGVVAAQYAEAGEIAQPGTPILTVTQLTEVTLTAYIPEREIGLVKLGQAALVSVDSYPEERFWGEVVYIAPRALFTPSNIQLKEEREKTVFAVKIRLANPEQKLKPGIPADVRIQYGANQPLEIKDGLSSD
jgi:HlyD family secretion protein